MVLSLVILPLHSSHKINIHKSNFYGIGNLAKEVSLMANNTGCTSGSFPFVYLGLEIGSNMKITSNWKLLLNRFHSRPVTLIKANIGCFGTY